MKVSNWGADHPFSIVRGRVAGGSATGTSTLATVDLVVITAAITADTNDWNPTGLSGASAIRADPDAAWNLTGIVSPGDDRLLILDNISAFDLTLIHDSTSTPGNRFLCPNDADLIMPPDTGVFLQYDVTSARWRVLGGAGTITPGGFVLTTEGGQETINARGNLGATETIDPSLGNIFTGTLNANCTVTLDPPVGSGGATLEGWFTQNGTGGWTLGFAASGGGSFQWDGTTPTLPTTAGVTFRVVFERIPATTNDWIGDLVGGGGMASPLTTKGDLWGYSTVDARVPVGANGTILTADSAQTLGLKWGQGPLTTTGDILLGATGGTPTRLAIGAATTVLTSDGTTASWGAGGAHYVVMSSGIVPPDPVLTSDGTDWVYSS